MIPLRDIDLTPDDPSTGADTSKLTWIGVAAVAIGVVGGLLALALPGLRHKIWSFVSAAWTNARQLATSPSRLARLLGADVASQLLFALTLGASVRAFGAHASLADLLLVNTGATLLTGVVPVPGGIGVAEASLSAGLVAVGVPQSAGLAAALVHRMCTFYLPPVWGWFSLRWLGRHGYV